MDAAEHPRGVVRMDHQARRLTRGDSIGIPPSALRRTHEDTTLARKTRLKLGEILVDLKLITKEQAEKAAETGKSSRKRIGEALIEMGLCGEEHVARALGNQFGLEYLNLDRSEDRNKVSMTALPQDVMKKFFVLGYVGDGTKKRLVIHDPLDLEMFDVLRFRVGAEPYAIASLSQIKALIDGGGGAAAALAPKPLVTSSIDSSMDRSLDRGASMDQGEKDEKIERGVVKLVDRLIINAVQGRASDIHIEPRKENVIVRYRVDGECVVIGDVPKKMQGSLLARVKLMAGVNISEKRIPQDGRIKMVVDGTPIDFRVSSCPAVHGESIVLRILRPDSANTALTTLGLEADSLDQFNRIIRRPNGIFLVTGPTGSGKTTTLYAALQTLNKPGVKIITAEDPVEYQFKGINQCQVREHIGLTFNAILKSMLRQAPNVILVGEIRDREVADIAIQAALTGHLVFSTLHTNDAPSSVTRLIDMGVKPFLVASSIQAVLGQRLVRCLHSCKVPNPNPDHKFMKLVGLTQADADSGQIMGPGGCMECIGGYRGRRAIFEMMVMNQEIRDLAFQRSGISKIRAAAIRGGMRTLVGDGRLKILKGIT
ncbi:MAG: type II/IV secretion system protein, partial [Phycisphaerae bacterium]|nr:type II/IV secretion system protein [Phycisphaerae bacterium]